MNTHICNHESCSMSSLRGLRNGVYYGGRIRVMHALVMTILFKKGSLKEKITNICELTFEHAKNLGLYVFFYKSFVCLLNRLMKGPSKFHSLLSGLVFGFVIWGKKNNVNYQIALYLLSRVIIGGYKSLGKQGKVPKVRYYPFLAAICWGLVMLLFEDDKGCLQPSLSSSMQFLYKDSDQPLRHWSELIPLEIPSFIEGWFRKEEKKK